MRTKRILVGSVLGVFAAAALAYCCGGYGEAKTISVKTDRAGQSAIVRDGKLYAFTQQGELISLDSPTEAVKSLGNFDLKPGALFDVAGKKACIAVQNRVYVADLTKGKIVAVQVFDQPITGLGFLSAERFYVQQGGGVQILETATAKTVSTVSLTGADKDSIRKAVACHAQGDRLYIVANGRKSGLLTVDWQNNKVLDDIPAGISDERDRLFAVRDLHVQGGKAFLATVFYSYGIPLVSVASIDLKTRKHTSLKGPDLMVMNWSKMASGPGDHFCLIGGEKVYQYDAQGKLIGSAQFKTNDRVLTVWKGRVVLAGQNTLELVPLVVKAAGAE